MTDDDLCENGIDHSKVNRCEKCEPTPKWLIVLAAVLLAIVVITAGYIAAGPWLVS